MSFAEFITKACFCTNKIVETNCCKKDRFLQKMRNKCLQQENPQMGSCTNEILSKTHFFKCHNSRQPTALFTKIEILAKCDVSLSPCSKPPIFIFTIYPIFHVYHTSFSLILQSTSFPLSAIYLIFRFSL